MTFFDIQVDSALEAAEELGFELPREVAVNIVTWLTGNVENRESVVWTPSRSTASNVDIGPLKAEIEQLKKENSAYRSSVMRRRRCRRVWIEDDSVMYD